MGRLVKAYSLDADSSRLVPSNEEQFLREAGELADRLRNEMAAQPDSAQAGAFGSARAGDSAKPSLSVVSRGDSEPSLLQDLELALKAGDLAEAREALGRLKAEQGRGQSGSSLDPATMEELNQQQRWAERHAEKSRQLEAREAEILQREADLQSQNKTIEDRVREIAVEVQAGLRDQVQAEINAAQTRIQQLEAELVARTTDAEHSRERAGQLESLIAELERNKVEVGREQTERAKRMIEDCDRRITELAAEKSAALREVAEARAELDAAHQKFTYEQAEQRNALVSLRDAHLQEVEAARAEVENARLNCEQQAAEWATRYESEQSQLAALRAAAQRELDELRACINSEQEAGQAKAEELRAKLAKLEAAQQEALVKARAEVATLVEREREKLNRQRAEMDQVRRDQEVLAEQRLAETDAEIAGKWASADQELSAAREILERERAELADEATEWQAEKTRDQRALQEERQRLEAEQAKVAALSAQLTAERNQLQDEWNAKFREAEERFNQQREQRLDELRKLDQEYSNREQLLHAKLSQFELEWTTRRRQMEHDLRVQIELAHKQLAEEREHFRQAADLREGELSAARAELERQRQSLEADRASVRRGLQQMDSQLRWFASNLDTPMPSVASSPASGVLNFSTSLNPTVARRVDPAATPFSTPHIVATTERSREPMLVGADLGELFASETVEPTSQPAVSSNEVSTPSITAGVIDEDSQAAAQPERRKALEQYRSRLSELQAQLSELQNGGASS